MIIACPNCEARYRIDDARVGSPGARLRCARCQTLFRLPESAPPSVPSASLAATLNSPTSPSSGSPGLGAPGPVAPKASAPETRLLVADPDPVHAAELIKRLAAQGVSAVSVTDGVETFLALQRARYPVVIVCAHLPRIRGEDLSELIKGTKSLKNTGVVRLGSGQEGPGLSSGGSFDLELDEADCEGRLMPFLESHGFRVKRAPQPKPAQETTLPAASSFSATEVESPLVSPTPVSGPEAERAKAERLARIVVSDMLLYHPDRFDQVRDEEGLLVEFAVEIREGESLLGKRVDAAVLSERDYLGDELRRAAQQRAIA